MRLRTLAPPPDAAPWIHHYWVFESVSGLPEGDLRVVVPNGRPKLIVPWRNGLTAEGAGRRQHSPTGEPILIGLWETPTVISSSREPTVTIGVEFTPVGLRRFLDLDLHELTGGILPATDVLGRDGREFARQVREAETVENAVAVVSRFLTARLGTQADPGPSLVDHAVHLMAGSGFRMEVSELEARMGYSRRYLSVLFQREVGLPPSRLQAILAFERLYRSFSRTRSVQELRDDALDLFCDQSHFIRHFRRFTGLPPTRFAEASNEFGLIFYRQPAT